MEIDGRSRAASTPDGGASEIDGLIAEIGARSRLVEVGRVLPARVHLESVVPAEIASERLLGMAVTPDRATCDDCLAELFDPSDRRYRYPFISCANCGPRFTIIRSAPFDRLATTMVGFAMCGRCRHEFDEPGNRRFQAQPIACSDCGPRLRVVDGSDEPCRTDPEEVLQTVVAGLLEGEILALKGLGGFQLVCRADHADAVRRLRQRKQRFDRPFAVLVADVAAARQLVRLTPADEALLRGPERPILLARRCGDASVVDCVAPGLGDLGVLLPETPMHHLIAADLRVPLVVTSGNRQGEPVAYRDEEALGRLEGLADRFLLHDRPIQVRADDSVVRSLAPLGEPAALMVRRGRGYAPRSLALPVATPVPILACGAELKSTFCLARGRRAWLGPHLGDLEQYDTLEAFEEGVRHFERLFGVCPQAIACDQHPDYLSTAYARRRTGRELVRVQHHHAHLAACLAEYGEEGPAIGAIFDGSGYGVDGAIWGGELLLGGVSGFRRVGHLWEVRSPGGEHVEGQPWRMACSWLVAATGGVPALPATLADRVSPARWREVAGLALTGFSSPPTTSVGRLFDAVAALCGLWAEVSWKGQAAVTLEAAAARARTDERSRYAIGIATEGPMRGGPTIVMDPRDAILALMRDLARGLDVPTISLRFHRGLARATAVACAELALRHGVSTVVLSGGVFQNRLLLGLAVDTLRKLGLTVRVPRKVPANDGGIAFGQAVVAASVLATRATARSQTPI